jgi:hypothetical protein
MGGLEETPCVGRALLPLLYRVMFADGDAPLVGTGSNCLGVRDGLTPEIPVDTDGTVRPDTGGMSVSPSLECLPIHLIPKRLRQLFPGATGSNNKPTLVPWHIGEGPFAAAAVTDDLTFRLDPRSPDRHGFIEPARPMDYNAYKAALTATRSLWVRHDWPPTPEGA